MRATVILAAAMSVLLPAGTASAQELIVSNGLGKPVVWTIDNEPGVKTARGKTAVRPLPAGPHRIAVSTENKGVSLRAARELDLQEDKLVTLGERRFWCVLVTGMDFDGATMPLLVERRGDECLALARGLK